MRLLPVRPGLLALSLGFLLAPHFADAEPRTFQHQRIGRNQAGQRRWLSTTGLQYTENTLRAVLSRRNKAGTNEFQGSARQALGTVEEAWAFAQQHPGDARVSTQVQDKDVKIYTVDMHRVIGHLVDEGREPLPATHVRLVVARGRYLIAASVARGAHADGTQWPAPKQTVAQHPAEALDDAALAQTLIGAGAMPQVATRAAQHVRMGLPSAATYTDPNDLLRVRNSSVLSMNSQTRILNWASWMTTKDHIDQNGERANNWRSDPTLGESFPRVDGDDYRGAGGEYHRGHMVRSGERSAKKRENEKTFIYSNAVPQAKSNNIGPWNGLEEWVRVQAQAGNRVLNLAGPAFAGAKKTLGNVAVPTSLWKIVAVLGPNEQTITASTHLVAVIIPNDHSVPLTANWADYRVPVEKIEQATGLRFFTSLPQPLADQLRKHVDTVEVPYVMPPHVQEELDRLAQRAASRGPRPAATTTAQQPPQAPVEN